MLIVKNTTNREQSEQSLAAQVVTTASRTKPAYLFSPAYPDVARQFGYLAAQPHALFSWQHFSTAAISRKTIVILCYPMGYEYTHSHRSFQYWADQLAAIGCLVIRFDYSGAGDSPGRELPDNQLPIWLENIAAIAEQARRIHPDYQLCLAGLRMGATLAYLAAQTLAADQLIVWEPIVQGRRYIRELQALSKFAVDSGDGKVDYTEFAGFLMSHATSEALKTVKLMDLPLPAATRVLCIYREDGDKHNEFCTWLSAQGNSVEVQCLPGYEDMLALPHETRIPHQAIAATATWLAQGTETTAETIQPLPQLSEVTLDTGVVEQGIWYDQFENKNQFGGRQQNHLFAILSRPKLFNSSRPLVVLLNSGAVHHVGPNRVYTHLARTIAESGLACLRLDLEGLGDSYKPDSIQENHPFQANAQANFATAISCLKNLNLAKEFIVMGICSGAHAAFHSALTISSPEVCEAVLINPLTFYWQDGMSLGIPNDIQVAHDAKYYSNSMRDPKKWLKLLSGKASTGAIIQFVKDRLLNKLAVKLKHLRENILDEHTQLSADLLRITSANIPVSLLISASDPGLEIVQTQARRTLKKGQASGIIRVKTFAGANHTFSGFQHRNDLLAYIRQKFSSDYQ